MGNPVTHWQMIAKDPDKLADFYSTLFDWKVNADNALNYRMISTGSDKGIDGGIWPAPPEANAFVQLFIEVDDVPAYVERVTQLGGNVIIPPQKLPEGQTMAVLQDPCGIPFALTTSA